MYDLKNNGRAVRITYDRNHLSVTVPPGATVLDVDMRDEDVQELHARKDDLVATRAEDRGKEVVDVSAQTAKAEADAPKVDANPAPVHTRPIPEKTTDVNAKKAQALLDQADSMEFNSWREEAQKLLGNKWPGGSPKKLSIADLLRQETKNGV